MRTSSLLSLVLFLVPSAAYAAAFSDVSSSHSFHTAIQYVYEEGIVTGYPDGTYRPMNVVNRAELTKIVVGTLFDPSDISSCDTAGIELTDVDTAAWYAPYVCVALEEGILSGYPDGTFRADRTVNLAETSKILALSFFEDVPSAEASEDWYVPFLDVLSEYAALPTSLGKAEDGLRRGELADMIFRIDAEVDTLPSLSTDDFVAASGDLGDEEFFMTEDDCLSDELYDPIERVCYIEIECETEAECQQKMAEIDAEAEAIDTAGDDYAEFDPESSEEVSARYTVKGDQIVAESTVASSDDTRAKMIWKHFITVIPSAARNSLVAYEISSDGKDGTLAAVYPSDQDPERWVLVVDDADAFNASGGLNTQDLTYSLIHEVGHLLTLRSEDVPPNPPQSDDASEFHKLRTACLPRYFTGEGCATEKSAINRFFQSFWKEWYATYADAFDGLGSEDDVPDLYSNSKQSFVSEYAASSPAEDIAESWTHFVLNEKPKPATVADQKVLFFYDFPHLVTLRTVLRQRL